MEAILREARDFKKILQCPICLDRLSHPFSLPCGHTFCNDCLSEATKARDSCPLCCKKVQKRNIINESNCENILLEIQNILWSLDPDQENNPKNSLLATQESHYSISVVEKPIVTKNLNEAIRQKREVVVKEPKKRAATSRTSKAMSENENVNVNETGQTSVAQNASPSVVQEPEQIVADGTISENASTKQFKVGDVVNVLSRSWPGINKPGGAAWVKSIEPDGSYNVKYILTGGGDHKVPAIFVEAVADLDKRKPRSSPTGTSEPIAEESQPQPLTKKRKSISSSKPTNSTSDNVGATTSTRTSKEKKKPKKFVRNLVSQRNQSVAGLPIVLLTTSLSVRESAEVESFGGIFNSLNNSVTIHNVFDETVTHLVVPTDEEGILQRRTMKYLQGIINGIWILSRSWITDSISSGRILPEENYEVAGNIKETVSGAPSRARLDVQQRRMSDQSCNLFGNVVACIHGSFPSPGPPKSDVIYLLDHGGATIIKSLNGFLSEKCSEKTILIIICAHHNSFCEATEALEAFDTGKLGGRTINITNPLWVLDSVTNYRVERSEKSTYKTF